MKNLAAGLVAPALAVPRRPAKSSAAQGVNNSRPWIANDRRNATLGDLSVMLSDNPVKRRLDVSCVRFDAR